MKYRCIRCGTAYDEAGDRTCPKDECKGTVVEDGEEKRVDGGR